MQTEKRQIRAVLFDMDDTLLDWSGQTGSYTELIRPNVDNMYEYLAADGHKLPERDEFARCYREVVVEQWGEAKKTWNSVHFPGTLEICFRRLGLDLDKIDLERVMRAYDNRPLPGVALFPDAIEVLQTLREQGYKVALVTNSMFPMWMRDTELHAFEIFDFFDVRITSGDSGYMKPHPAIYERALDLLGVLPDEAVFVGDRPANDIAGANEVGLVSVLISPAHLERELDGVEPDYIISTLSELPPILDKLEGKQE